MNLDTLKQRLRKIAGLEPDQFYEEFRRRTGSSDGDQFLSFLREKNLISTVAFVELAGGNDIELTAVGTVAAVAARTVAGRRSMSKGPGTKPATAVPATATPATATPATAPATDASGTDPPSGEGDTLVGESSDSRALPPRPDAGDDTDPAEARYTLMGLLGKGAMGEVLVAKDIDLRRKVAYKRMLPTEGSGKLAERFLEEIQVTAQLDHPNVVPIYGLEVGADGSLAYAMKLVRGVTFAELLEQAQEKVLTNSVSDERERLAKHLDHFLRVCDGMSYAHSKGVLHRDLKPENVMVGGYNEVYVMDWGICRVIGSVDSSSDQLTTGTAVLEAPDDSGRRTQYGAVIGTPRYLSPEQAMGRNPELDVRSDIYTLGLNLQEIVTLRRAVVGTSVQQLIEQAKAGHHEPPVHRDRRISVARELCAIIAKATAVHKEQRYPTVAELADDVRRFQRGEAVRASRDNPLQAATRWMSLHRVATLAAMMVLLVAGAGATIVTLIASARSLERAHRHEERLQAFLSCTSSRSHRIDNHFHRYEAALVDLGGRAVQALTSPPPPGHRILFMAEDFDANRKPPPDSFQSKYYGAVISLGWPSFKLAPGLRAEDHEADMRALGSLAPAFRAMLLASQGERAEQVDSDGAAALIGGEGVPMLRASITLASGVHVVYPGLGGFHAEYDGRNSPKYKLAEEKHGIQSGNPYPDRHGHSLLLPSAIPLYDDGGRFLGVAGFDMTFQFIQEKLLAMPECPAVDETFLVDDQGRVLARAVQGRALAPGEAFGDARDHLTQAGHDAAVPLDPLHFPQVVTAVQQKQIGHVELAREARVVAYYPLESLGWYYVAVADSGRLFQ